MQTAMLLPLLSVLSSTPPSSALIADAVVPIWVRAPGDYAQGIDHPPASLLEVDLNQLTLGEERRYDLQYGKWERYLGVELLSLILRHPRAEAHDLALLHFENGVLIPLPYKDAGAMARIDAFLAVGRWSEGDQRFDNQFPEVDHGGAFYVDRRPTVFSGVKVVVEKPWHPFLRDSASPAFSPWQHADTLLGVELVQQRAWDRQFEVKGGPRVRRGQERFKESCAWCHGARGVGAHYGWDLMEPFAVTTYHPTIAALYYHVRFRPSDAREKGERMPGLKHMGEPEVGDIWTWLKALAVQRQGAYAPSE